MVVGLYVTMSKRPGIYPTKPLNILAHPMDVKIADQGSYLDARLSNEGDLKTAYHIGMSLVRALGGLTRCDRTITVSPRRLSQPIAKRAAAHESDAGRFRPGEQGQPRRPCQHSVSNVQYHARKDLLMAPA
jgi:hypothetical protein